MMITTRATPSAERWKQFHQFNTLYTGGRITPVWAPDGSTVCFLDGATAKAVDPDSGEVRQLWDTDRLLSALGDQLGRPVGEGELSQVTFRFAGSQDRVRLTVGGKDLRIDLRSYAIEPVPQKEIDAEAIRAPNVMRGGSLEGAPPIMEVPSPDGLWMITEAGDNLALRSTLDGRLLPLTEDGTPERPWDASSAHWSPDGFRLTAARIDTTGVGRLLRMHWLQQAEQVEDTLYPRAGGLLPRTERFIIDRFSRERIAIDPSLFLDRDTVFDTSFVAWRAESDEIIFDTYDLQRTRRRRLAADARTGAVRLVLEEEADAFPFSYLRLDLERDCAAVQLAGGKEFIWASDRDGWLHLYRYDYAGNLLNQLTRGAFEVASLLGVDEEAGYVYVAAAGLDRDRPYDIHAARVPPAGGEPELLTEKGRTHTIQLSPSRKVFLDTHSTVGLPPQTDLRRADGTHLATLSVADTSTLDELGWIPPEEFVVKAADGVTDLYGTMYFPPGFDPHKRYPVIDSIYGGPQMCMHAITFAQEIYGGLPGGPGMPVGVGAQALAQLGFITFSVDSRGTPLRGSAFGKHTLRRMGQDEIPDHVAALRQLAADRPFMDLERVGIAGGSYGGYMTLRGLLLAPEVYSVGVASAPMVDHWDIGAHHSGIMDLPQHNHENYVLGSNPLQADRLQGRLLLIHGASDRNAPVSGTMKMVDALIKAGKPFDLLIVPEMVHGFNAAQRPYVLGREARYLVEHLKPEGIDPESIPLA